MSNKRFTLHIGWYNYEKTEGDAELRDNGQPILESECVEDMRHLKDLLNEQHEEIERLKQENMELTLRCKPLFSKRQLHDENQQLKAEIKQLNHDLELYEENNTNEVLNKLRVELTSRMNDCIEEFKI